MTHVFLNYAREDADDALALYNTLDRNGFSVWLDSKSLLPGQRWQDEIDRAIKGSAAFVALISKNSINKRGYVQKELREALNVLAETPANQIYLLPVRLEDVFPNEPQLSNINWLDLFRDRDSAIARLVDALSTIPSLSRTSDRDGHTEYLESPLTGFESKADFFRSILERIPSTYEGANPTNNLHFSFLTEVDGVLVPEFLREKYKPHMTLILQYQYRDLVCDDESLSVTLWFNGNETRIRVPFDAMLSILEPDIDAQLLSPATSVIVPRKDTSDPPTLVLPNGNFSLKIQQED